jgi:hypothetical protein
MAPGVQFAPARGEPPRRSRISEQQESKKEGHLSSPVTTAKEEEDQPVECILKTSTNSPSERRSVATSGSSITSEGLAEHESCKEYLSLGQPTSENQPADPSSKESANSPGRSDFAVGRGPNMASAVRSEVCEVTSKAVEEKTQNTKDLSQRKQGSAMKHPEEKKISLYRPPKKIQ